MMGGGGTVKRKGSIKPDRNVLENAFESHRAAFEREFGHPLRIYWDRYGFDILRFMEDLNVPPGSDPADAVAARWGEAAATMVQALVLASAGEVSHG